MMILKNLQRRTLAIPLPGKGLLLAPGNTPGDEAAILDREVKEPIVKNLIAAGRVKLLPYQGQDFQPADELEVKRVNNHIAAEKAAKARNARAKEI